MTDKFHEISLLRVFAMSLILFCHVFSWLGMSLLSQLFNVGIFLFFLISGWLYSTRTIDDSKKWIIKRWKKLCVPVILWMTIVIIYQITINHIFPTFFEIITIILNLQGLPWILTKLPKFGSFSVALIGLSHLWFVTIIFVCYLLLLVVKNNEKKLNNNKALIVVMILVCIFLLFLKINTTYFVCFFIGFGIGKKHNMVFSFVEVVVASLAMLIAVATRLFSKSICDGSFLYDYVIVGLTHTILAIWFFILTFYLYKHFSLLQSVASSKAIKKMDEYSYYIYVTHYFFLDKSFGLSLLANEIYLQIVAFLILTTVMSLFLKFISDQVLRTIRIEK